MLKSTDVTWSQELGCWRHYMPWLQNIENSAGTGREVSCSLALLVLEDAVQAAEGGELVANSLAHLWSMNAILLFGQANTP